MTKRLITIALLSCVELCGLAAQDSIVQDTTVTKRQKPPRNYFTHRAIALNTAAPLPKGTVNFYNYYLLYNEVEYAFHDRFAASVGYVFLFDDSQRVISTRLRYQIPINKRLHWALGYHGLVTIDRYSGRSEFDIANLWSSTLTYCAPQLTASITGGAANTRTNDTFGTDEQGMMAGLSAIWVPKRNGIFGIIAEHHIGPGSRIVTSFGSQFRPMVRFNGFGFQFSGRRMAFQIFAASIDEGYNATYWRPGASLRFMLSKPRKLVQSSGTH
jgi:hypothetical protein